MVVVEIKAEKHRFSPFFCVAASIETGKKSYKNPHFLDHIFTVTKARHFIEAGMDRP